MPSVVLSTSNITPLLANSASEPYFAYLLLAVMAVLAVGFACGPLILSAIVAPRKPSDIKQAPFELSLIHI